VLGERVVAGVFHTRKAAVDVVGAEVEHRAALTLHAVHAAALIALLPHQVLHAGHAGALDPHAADAFPELLPALEILRRKLQVHDFLAHVGPPFGVKLYAPRSTTKGRRSGSRDRAVRARDGGGPLRAARRALPQSAGWDVPSREGLRRA